MTSNFHFQIDLRGIIDVLSASLYSGPKVFIRELLQNATDAIRARQAIAHDAAAVITVELIDDAHLSIRDSGIGLTEREIHQFLATIGASSKRAGALDSLRSDFIGSFGIGLLSCFMVSDEIVLITKSAKTDEPAHEWRGKSDGTYTLRPLQTNVAPGTTVYLKAKPDAGDLFKYDQVKSLLQYYGGLLPFPIQLRTPSGAQITVNEIAPWRQTYANHRERRRALLDYGQRVFGEQFLDVVELGGEGDAIEGIALIRRESPAPAARGGHRIYLKNMLLTEKADGLLPDWAFFARLLVNVTDLHPAASRESFHEDDSLAGAQESLSETLQQYLLDLAEHDPKSLTRLIAIHYLSIKALAVQDDEVYRVFIDYLPFETTMGTLTLKEITQRNSDLRYVPHHDQFRQIAQVMAAQDGLVVDGGYTYDRALIERYRMIHPEVSLTLMDATDLVNDLEELKADERDATFDLLDLAARTLRRHHCRAQIRRFAPATLTAIYSVDEAAQFRRDLERTKETVDGLWSDVLDGLSESAPPMRATSAQLCLNYSNDLIRHLATIANTDIAGRVIEMLYVQSLLLGHHPLGQKEMRILTTGLTDLINLAIAKGTAE
jgi:molecular chaperone HtpG